MPWYRSSVVDQRLQLVMKVEREGVALAVAAAEFGVSRPTAYKWLKRYRSGGEAALLDESRAPQSIPHRTESWVEERVVAVRRQYPSWGARKVRALLLREAPGHAWPSASTIGAILERHDLVAPRTPRRRVPPYQVPLRHVSAPNQVWCIDFKGQFRLGDGTLCYPLTLTDAFSRYLLCCTALGGTSGDGAEACVQEVFARHGVPDAIRSDNGSPFATRGLLGLSTLSAGWLEMGIRHERIEVGHPEQNGRHERMHLTLKQETTRPAAASRAAQQARFDDWIAYFNTVRPHEALGMKVPADVYVASERRMESIQLPDYAECDDVRTVRSNGTMKLCSTDVTVSQALRGRQVGIIELDPDVWLIRFAGRDLGLVERGERQLSRLVTHSTITTDNPVGADTGGV